MQKTNSDLLYTPNENKKNRLRFYPGSVYLEVFILNINISGDNIVGISINMISPSDTTASMGDTVSYSALKSTKREPL